MFTNAKVQTVVVLVASLLLGFVAVLQSEQAVAQKQPAPEGFSFAVFGDSRSMLYLPYKKGQEERIHKLLVDVFSLVLPEKVSEEVVKRDVKLTFDPLTKELVHVQMPFETKTEVMFLTLDKGWVTEAAVEDVKLLPGVRRTIFRLGAGEWVSREIVREVQTGRASFLINTGDIVWWGKQGITLQDSPFWQRVNKTMLSKLPAPDVEMNAAGLEGRIWRSLLQPACQIFLWELSILTVLRHLRHQYNQPPFSLSAKICAGTLPM